MAAKIRKGDKVVVIAGRDKGRTGEVIEVRPSEGRALVRVLAIAQVLCLAALDGEGRPEACFSTGAAGEQGAQVIGYRAVVCGRACEGLGGELTAERIGQIWMEVQAESLGPAVELNEGYESYWCYVPHFVHSPFYVYAYAFGDCLVNSLYGLYQDAHPGFVSKYVAMLEAGGSKHHSELLQPFGLDATQREFWQKGLKVLEGMIDELERM